MARITTYNNDIDVIHLDKWIGTDATNGFTKNFKAEEIGKYLNKYSVVSILGQLAYKFNTDINPPLGRGRGTITLPNGGGDGAGFSALENFKVNKYSSYNYSGGELKDLGVLLEYFFKYEVVIFKATNPNIFGHFRFESFTVDTENPGYYDVNLGLIYSNGTLEKDEFYAISMLGVGTDKHYMHDQDSASAIWSVTHNLYKYPSVTVVDSGENIVYGDVAYINDTQLTINFTSAFSGKAYLN